MRVLPLILLAVLPLEAQVMLPHRHPVSVSASGATSTNPPFSDLIIFWLTAQSFQGQSEGTTLTNWPDLTFQHTDFITNTGASSFPTFTTNGVSTNTPWAAYFNSTNMQYFIQKGATNWWANGYNGYQVFMVLKVDPGGFNDVPGHNAVGGLHGWSFTDGGSKVHASQYTNFLSANGHVQPSFLTPDNNDKMHSNSVVNAATWHRLTLVSGTNAYGLYQNNSPVVTTNVNTPGSGAGYSSTRSTIGKAEDFDGSFAEHYFFNGWISEVIMYHTNFNNTDQTTVDNWLTNKYTF